MHSEYTVVITRPDGQSFAERLRAAGFSILEMPVFQIVPIDPGLSLALIREKLKGTDWLIFTSRNGVRFFHALVGDSISDKIRVATIGARTGDAFSELFKRSVTVRGEGGSSEKFALELFPSIERGATVLLPTARHHRDVIALAAIENGVELIELPVYDRTSCAISAETLRVLNSKDASHLLWPFFSPSAFHECLERSDSIEQALRKGRIVTIGDTTTSAVIERGFTVFSQSAAASEEGMLEELKRCVSGQGTR